MTDDPTVRDALLAAEPPRAAADPDWADVLRRLQPPDDRRPREARVPRLRPIVGDGPLGPTVVDCGI